MTDLTARGAAASESRAGNDFSAAPWPTIRRILEVMGWFAVALLVLTGLIAILGRAIFLNDAFSQPVANPAETFDLFEIRYYTHYLATLLHLGPGFLVMVPPLKLSCAISA